jgi:hypothetical protein
MFKKRAVLSYESAVSGYPNIITPSKNLIPEWYKKIPKWKNNEVFTIEDGFGNSVKQCMPFLESLSIGYMIVLPHDLYVKNNNGIPYVSWKDGIKFFPKWRTEPADQNIVPAGHHSIEYTWQTAVANTIPVGYSLIFTHPFNRHDLPFTTLTGIVDGGFVMSSNGNIPFFIKKDFEGIIPQGTPIAQIIPFRQENWSSKIQKGLIKKSEDYENRSTAIITGWYKKTFWTRKRYD